MKRTFNNNYSVLPFYKDRQMQYRYLTYSYGDIYPLYCPKNMRPCFQILEPDALSSAAPNIANLQFYLMDKNNNYVSFHGTGAAGATISLYNDLYVQTLSSGGYAIVGCGEYDHGATGAANTQLLPIGTYYIMAVDNDNTLVYYSEFFTVIDTAKDYTKIEWYNIDDLQTESGAIIYSLTNPTHQFRNIVYLLTQLGKPEYQFDEEGESRNGHFFATKQVSYKKYKAVFEAPEYLLDAMRLIRLADYVKVTDPYGTEFVADTFLITPNWLEQGNIANCTIEITSDTVAKKCGKAIT